MTDTQWDAPYADGLRRLGRMDFQHLHVPGHHGRGDSAPGLERVFGAEALRIDKPMLFSGVDTENWRMNQGGRPSRMQRSLKLAAEAWGASRAWFLVNGASSGNHIASLAIRCLGPEVLVQRSMHSSVIDGMMIAGLEPHFLAPTVDTDLGSAHGVTAQQVAAGLDEHPGAAAVYLVSPSYFGAVADVAAIAEVAHARGLPLVVDESWGSHLGFHPDLPQNALRLGADVVVSSTHKFVGSLTQTAMLFLGTGPIALGLAETLDRAYRSLQSTSSSALLTLSLDEARRTIATEGEARIGGALADAEAIRDGVRAAGRFRVIEEEILGQPDVFALDPFKIVIDTRPGGISGTEAHHRLLAEHRVVVELSTHAVIVVLLGATARQDVQRFLAALHALPEVPESLRDPVPVPRATVQVLGIRQAFLSPFETVPWQQAIGRVSADSLAAYPPGIPNVIPGELLSPELVRFLRVTAAAPAGFVRGAVHPELAEFRVLRESN